MTSLDSFGAEETHGMVFRPSVESQLTSDGYGWGTLYACSQREYPYEGVFPAVKDQLLVWHRDGPARIEGKGGEKRFHKTVPPGGFHLIPGGASFSINLRNTLDTMHVYIRRDVLQEVAAEMVVGDPARVEIAPRVLDRERMLASLLCPIQVALSERNAETALCADYLSVSLAAHLVRHYSDAVTRLAPGPSMTVAGSSSGRRAVEYMHDNIAKPICLADIARAAGLSTSQVARVFKAEYGVPPHRFLINLRVEKAQALLQNTDLPIVEIALECGFSHQEHLTHQFRRTCGTTPAAYRRSVRH